VHVLSARGVAWSLWLLAMLAWTAELSLWVAGGFPPLEPAGETASVVRLGYAITFVTVSTIGLLIASRHPSNPIGWLVLTAGLVVAMDLLAIEYATSRLLATPGGRPPAAVPVAWLGNVLGVNPVLVVPLLLLVPDGRLPSARWRPVLWLAYVSGMLAFLALAFKPGPLGNAPSIVNPLGIEAAGPLFDVLLNLATIGLPIAILLAMVSLVLRFRVARGEARQQLKWITYAGAAWAVALAATFATPTDWRAVTSVVYIGFLDAFVVAFGLAILKYRLYAVDLVINRTLVYGTLGLCITLVYVGLVAAAGALAAAGEDPNLILSLLAAPVVAVAFQPLRERVQRVANRLVYGQRATPYEVVADFSRRLAGGLSIDAVLPSMAEAAARGLGAQRTRVRVYVPGGRDRLVSWPPEALGEPFERAVPVLHQQELVGEIALSKPSGEPLSQAEAALLDDLAAQAGPALSNVRLTEELRASRQRIVAAQDAERRRIERDLHDGVQQYLVAMAVNLQIASELVSTDPAEATALLAEIGTQAQEALTDLRDLARGIYPPTLADRGLVAALEAHLAKVGPQVRLEVEPTCASARFSPDVEAAVYFCCLEALQNAAKHTPAGASKVQLAVDGGWLSFCVTDAGPGFDAARPPAGTGLHGMADRLEALGGSLSVRSEPDGGTTVSGRLRVPPSAHDGRAAAATVQAEARVAGPNSAFGR
jgi:signal transduction histidine kinase